MAKGNMGCLNCSYLLLLLLLVLLSFFICAHGQKPSGFINIDCGLASNSSFVDSFTGLTYVSDDEYIDTGSNAKISSQYAVNKDKYANLETLRSFPNGTKNCYTIQSVTQGSKYLVRATFYYGNYDRLEKPPSFDLYLGVNFWSTVDITESDYWYFEEIIAIAPANYIDVCLVNTGSGTPFISALELRPFSTSLYNLANSTQSLSLFARRNVGSNINLLRYPNDIHDRLWLNYTKSSWNAISTDSSIDDSITTFELPSLVLQTAAVSSTPNTSMDIIKWSSSDESTQFYVVLHFSELQKAQNNSVREFNVYANGEIVPFDNPVTLGYLTANYFSYLHKLHTEYNVSLVNSARATLPPILNAYELYTVLPVTSLLTDNEDVSAIKSIKASYGIIKGWNGDPCLPENISWTGVHCKINLSYIPRITALNLSSFGLTGAMVSDFGNLIELETLDLSHNNLSGNIPSSLDQLQSLAFLDLSGNNDLSRLLPPSLQKKKDDGHLTVLFNSTITSTPGHKGSSKTVIYVVVAVVIVLLVVAAASLYILCWKKPPPINPPTTYHVSPEIPVSDSNSDVFDGPRKYESGPGRNDFNFNKRQFSYYELRLITNEFSQNIGRGGFGEVFKGRLENGNEVAVKVRSESSSQGTQQFLNEVEKLSRVHHKNLVSLVGYCKDGNYIAVVYEYIEEGNLQVWLRGNVRSLSWKQRLRIAYESAQGLDYLHKMCSPPIIHRDIKTSNILLTRNLEARVSDFGLARASSGPHVSTRVVGTPGYLDPYYAHSSQLTKRSDVYSFGVVLLEIITGKPPIGQGSQGVHLTQFVQQRLSRGNIEGIVDPLIGHQYNLNSIWKVADLALKCTDHPTKRPDMTAVVKELQESLNLEMTSTETGSMASGDTTDYSGYSRNENIFSGAAHNENIEMARIGGTLPPDYGPLAR